jgi:hypothetical protein
VGDLTNQVHDWNPGIRRSGLFWTIPLPRDDFSADADDGRARFHATHLRVPDYHSIANAISPSPKKVPGHVSFDMRWAGGGKRTRIHDETFGFAGDFREGPLHIRFTARDDGGGVYWSQGSGQVTVGGGVGHERNGVFFDPDDERHSGHARKPTRSRWTR